MRLRTGLLSSESASEVITYEPRLGLRVELAWPAPCSAPFPPGARRSRAGQICSRAMSERARKLLQDAMELPLPERAELATDLLASLDGEAAEAAEAAWVAEIERRARAAIADPDDDVAWETVRAELHAE